MIEKNKYFKNLKMKFLTISGKDRFTFLQGLISNDLKKIEKKKLIYTSFLSPQGRFLFDFFICEDTEMYLIECDVKFIEELKTKLMIYKLRSDVKINYYQEVNTFLINKSCAKVVQTIKKNFDLLTFEDPRPTTSLFRIYTKNTNFKKINENLRFSEITKIEYEKSRIKNSIPDFSIDAEQNKSLLLELRFDELNGIDWDKGCYMGQELTARTKYRGKIRKKLYGIKSQNKISGNEIKFDDKVIGFVSSFSDNSGIAIINTEIVEDKINHKQKKLLVKNTEIIPFIPKWAK